MPTRSRARGSSSAGKTARRSPRVQRADGGRPPSASSSSVRHGCAICCARSKARAERSPLSSRRRRRTSTSTASPSTAGRRRSRSWSCAAARCSIGASCSGRGRRSRAGAASLRAPAADLRPHRLSAQGDPPAVRDRRRRGARRLAVGAQGRARLPALSRRADRRPSGSRIAPTRRRVRVSPPLPRASLRATPAPRALARAPRSRRRRRDGSRASTSRTCRERAVVASMVVWRDGRMRKGEYRSFNIRGFVGQDDFRVDRRSGRAALSPAAARSRASLPGPGPDRRRAAVSWTPPLAALAGLGLEECRSSRSPSARRRSTCPGAPEPLRLPRADEGLRLLQRLRDEAHRFAVSRHRAPAHERSPAQPARGDPGVGPARRKLLAKRFGTWEVLARRRSRRSRRCWAKRSAPPCIATCMPALQRPPRSTRLRASMHGPGERTAGRPSDASDPRRCCRSCTTARARECSRSTAVSTSAGSSCAMAASTSPERIRWPAGSASWWRRFPTARARPRAADARAALPRPRRAHGAGDRRMAQRPLPLRRRARSAGRGSRRSVADAPAPDGRLHDRRDDRPIWSRGWAVSACMLVALPETPLRKIRRPPRARPRGALPARAAAPADDSRRDHRREPVGPRDDAAEAGAALGGAAVRILERADPAAASAAAARRGAPPEPLEALRARPRGRAARRSRRRSSGARVAELLRRPRRDEPLRAARRRDSSAGRDRAVEVRSARAQVHPANEARVRPDRPQADARAAVRARHAGLPRALGPGAPPALQREPGDRALRSQVTGARARGRVEGAGAPVLTTRRRRWWRAATSTTRSSSCSWR